MYSARPLHSGNPNLRSRPWIAVLAVCMVPAVACFAAGDIPLVNIDGTLCLRVVLQTSAASVPAHVVLDLGTRGPMLVHYGTAALLGFQSESLVDVTHEPAGVTLNAVKSVAMQLEPLEELTREHARALDDIPAVAVLGLPAFAGSIVELDVGANLLRVLAKGPGSVLPSEDAGKAVTFSYTEEAYGYWLTTQSSNGTKLRTRFATSEFDTRIDQRMAESLGFPGGNLDRLMLGTIDFARYAVLRPSDMSVFPEPRPDLIVGTQLLSSFRVRIDPDERQITFIPTREPTKAVEEQSFFVARADRNVEQVETFLREYPRSRLAKEAAEVLLNLCLKQTPTDPAAVKRALERRADAAEPNRRAMALIVAADELIAMDAARKDVYDLAMIALDLAKPYASSDLNDVAIHHLNARLGLISLLRNDYKQARRWLLSAAFGMPKDPYVNFYLGFLYDRTGQQSRAWSRYLESCLKPEPPVGAMRGLDRLNNDPVFRKNFTITEIEQLLEGRVPAFVPPRVWEATSRPAERPVRLVELFTSVEVETTQAAQMAFDGLAKYLSRSDTLLLAYHVDDVLASDATDARMAFYETQSCPAAFFDGSGPVADGGEDDAAPRVFGTYREHAVGALTDSPTVATVTGEARLTNDNLKVKLEISAEQLGISCAFHAMICEQAVIAVGANGQMLHRRVVRAPLTPANGLLLGSSPRTSFRTEVSLWAASQRLKQRISDLGRKMGAKPAMRPTWIDARACQVVAFIQDTQTRSVLWAGFVPIVIEGQGQ